MKKVCSGCGVLLTEKNFRKSRLKSRTYRCNDCERKYHQKWRENNREKAIKAVSKYKEKFIKEFGLEAWHKRNREICRRYREGHRKEAIERTRKWKRKIILEVLTHYGGDPPKCACCGETQILFLTIDHIHGGGNKHRRKLFGTNRQGGISFYQWLRKNNFPRGYQVLCFNCNMGKSRNDEICPHKKVVKEWLSCMQ